MGKRVKKQVSFDYGSSPVRPRAEHREGAKPHSRRQTTCLAPRRRAKRPGVGQNVLFIVFKLPSITHQSVSPHSLWLSNSAACQVPINCRRCGARRLGTLGGNIGRAGADWFSRCDGPPAAGAGSCCVVSAAGQGRGSFDGYVPWSPKSASVSRALGRSDQSM